MDAVKKYIKNSLEFQVYVNHRDFQDIPELEGAYNGRAYRKALEALEAHETILRVLVESMKTNCALLEETTCATAEDC